jgi:outer membrane protein TolC
MIAGIFHPARCATLARTLLAAPLVFGFGCASSSGTSTKSARPDLAMQGQMVSGSPLKLNAADTRPMYRELLAIDLATVVRVSTANNPEIRIARSEVEASRGRLESTIGGAFPALVPTALFEQSDGTARAVNGSLVGAGFNTFQMSVAIQWIINPGRVAYQIVAARKRLAAVEHQEQAVVLATLRQAIVQYYDLALAQARISAARQAEAESDELLRITKLRVSTGTGVLADELRAEAKLAERRQDGVLSLNAFFDASVALSLTLQLDSTVTLVPRIEELPEITLVRPEAPIDELLALAVQYRPDLASVRALAEVAAANRGAAWWGNLGPQFQVGYQYGGITGHSNGTHAATGIPNNLIVNPFSPNGSFTSTPIVNGAIKELISRGSQRIEGASDETFGVHDQQRASAGAGWRLSLAAFGDLKAANAGEQQAAIEVEQRIELLRAQVVSAQQASRANHELIELARQQVRSAEEALRLTQANLKVGTMTTLDVLQAQDVLAQARLRFADAIVHYNQAQVSLLAVVGLLSEDRFTPS